MLGEQFFDNPAYKDFLTKNFILFQVFTQEPAGRLVFDKYAVRATPTTMFFDGNGEAVDWILGYDPPADKFRDQVDRAMKGIGTFKSLTKDFAAKPDSVEIAFNLGRKYDDRYDTVKASEFYKKVLALDPEGKKGSTDYEAGRSGPAAKVTYAEYAEFNLGAAALSARPPDRAPMQAFIKKYADGPIVEDAYSRLSRAYYGRTASKEEAAAFYAEYAGRFPQSVAAMSSWVQRILQDKEPVDKGIELALKARDLQKAQVPSDETAAGPRGGGSMLALNLARLYNLKGEKTKAVETADGALNEAGDNDRMISMVAQTYLEIGAEDKALAVYGPAFLKKNMGDAAILSPYASFWTRQNKNLDSALEAAKKGTALAADDYRSWITLGNVYLKMKNAAEAVKAADKALEIAPAGFQAVAKRAAEQIKTQAAAIK